MGMVLRKVITNILEVPLDIMANFVGKGMKVNRNEAPPLLEVSVGEGLVIDQQSNVSIDKHEHEANCSLIRVVTDVSIALDCPKLTLTKTLVSYKVKRNRHGFVLDIVPVDTWKDQEEAVFTDPCYTAHSNNPTRQGSPNLPAFYKR